MKVSQSIGRKNRPWGSPVGWMGWCAGSGDLGGGVDPVRQAEEIAPGEAGAGALGECLVSIRSIGAGAPGRPVGAARGPAPEASSGAAGALVCRRETGPTADPRVTAAWACDALDPDPGTPPLVSGGGRVFKLPADPSPERRILRVSHDPLNNSALGFAPRLRRRSKGGSVGPEPPHAATNCLLRCC